MKITNSSASTYAQFGVTNATVSGELTEHEEAMVALASDVRDGDDRIITEEEPTEGELDATEDLDTSAETDSTDGLDESGEGSDEEAVTDEEEELPVGTDGSDLIQLEEGLKEHAAATKELLYEAIAKGLPPEMESTINAEYLAGEGLSADTYEALGKAGYSKGFVNAYISGQEAVARQFADSVVSFAGGREALTKIQSFMATHNPDAAESFNDAIDRVDSKAIKTLISMTKTMMGKTFGSRPARTIVAAKQPVTTSKPVETFESRDDMIKAMSDPRYSRDESYRKAVEAKLFASKF